MYDEPSILIIEDEENIIFFVKQILSNHNFQVYTAGTGQEGLELVSAKLPDVILLDLGLPDIDGMKLIDKLRTWYDRSIIVLSARNAESSKVQALDAGADDYITKPFGSDELLARIRTALRHHPRSLDKNSLISKCYQAHQLTIDFEKRRVFRGEEEIHLTPIEYKIVAYLAKNSGKILTYSSILENVWGPFLLDDNKILRVNMANIRRKIEIDPSRPEYIFTEVGVGYRMLEENLPNNNGLNS